MSAFFDDSHIQQVIASVNIVDLIGRYVALKPKGKDFIGLCPFHDDHKPSFSVSPVKQIFKCFSCGAGGDAIKFMMRREQMTFPEAVENLADQVGVALPQRRGGSAVKGGQKKTLEQLSRWAARTFRDAYEQKDQGKTARDYVQSRGITEETARKFGLGWVPDRWDYLTQAAEADHCDIKGLTEIGLLVERDSGGCYDRFRQRLIFPVMDALGRVVAFGGRTLGNDDAKYLNSPESVLFNKSRTLYGLNLAKDQIVKSRTAVVVEGYIDCVMAHQFGVSNVVATLGTALTSEHARILARYAQQIILVFDADQAGQKAADRAVELFFGEKLDVRLVKLPDGSDPSDFLLERGQDAFAALLDGAIESLEYKWQVLLAELEASNSVNGRKKAVEAFFTLISRAFVSGKIDTVSRGLILNRVAKLLGQLPEQVHKRVNELAKQSRSRTTAPTQVGQNKVEDFGSLNGMAKAYQEILEVLLNRPDFFEQAQEQVHIDEIEEPRLQSIARHIWEYFERGGRGEANELLAGCEDIAMSDLVTTLIGRGAKRENYEQTLKGALKFLEDHRLEQSRQELRSQLVTAGEDFGDDAQAAMLMAIQDQFRENPRCGGG